MELTSQLVLSWIGVQLVELLKRWSGVPWITQYTDKMNKAVGALIAAFAAVGITFTYDPQAGTLLVTGLTTTTLLTLLWNWLSQFILQQMVYHGIVKNGTATNVQMSEVLHLLHKK